MNKPDLSDFNRRDFLKGSSFAALMVMLGGVEITAQEKPKDVPETKPATPPVPCGLIGCGAWGREILESLARLPNAPVVAICDYYEAYLNRAKKSAPNAKAYADYKQLLADKDVKAVIIATPTHQHKEIVLAAIAAGKHVYCEAPLAHTIEDARAIAKAAKANPKINFQAGLQNRSDVQRHFLLDFVRTGAMGRNAMARAQWHKKESWRRTSPNPEREKEINWRLRSGTSLGLAGELGIHQIDAAGWFLRLQPVSVTGFGSSIHWKDGRDVPDTVQAIIEYADGVRMIYDSSLVSSFDADYEMYYGSDATLMVRGSRAWMFKEADSPLLGWEVYARKDQFYRETGIALVANATKLTAQSDSITDEPPITSTPLYLALSAFVTNSYNHGAAVEDFIASFGAADNQALIEYLADINKNKVPAAGFDEGFAATVTAIKVNEAIVKGQKIAFDKQWFALG
ncbi:MAG: Gfo/Idh/MocA family oxidoreductase [Verrucomicrobiota bacterium]